MSNQKLKLIVVGGAALFVLWKVIQATNAKPLQSGIDPNNIKPDSIGRALDKLTSGGVKVNDTPTETINAIGK
jgi:hypothetical protein